MDAVDIHRALPNSLAIQQRARLCQRVGEVRAKRTRRTRQLQDNPSVKSDALEAAAHLVPVNRSLARRQVIVAVSAMIVRVYVHEAIARDFHEAIPVAPEGGV